MAAVKRSNAKLQAGILGNASGKLAALVVQKQGVIRIAKMYVKRKRHP